MIDTNDRTDITFTTDKGSRIRLVWQKAEYRAFIYNARYDEWQDMKIGATIPYSLQDYIKARF